MNDYSVSEVAKQLNVSSRTVQREIKRGKLVAHRVGRKFLVSQLSLERYQKNDSSALDEKIKKFCQSRKYEMVNLLQKMVAMSSNADDESGQEEFARFLKETLEKLGLRTVMYGEKGASTIHATFGYAKKGILMDCPIDTVSVGDLHKWSYPPFDGIIKNGKMYGRGTADCKAGIVCMIYSVLALKEVVDENAVRIELVFDGGEHNGQFLGIKETLDRGIDVEAGIVGYAGVENELAIGARGNHRYLFTIKGQSEHTGSRTRRGVNAIVKTTKFINELEKIKLPQSKHDLFWFGSKVTPSMINGGTAVNIVPDICKVYVDTRLSADLKRKDIEDKIKHLIKQLKKADPEFEIEMEYLTGHEGYMLDPNEKIIQLLLTAIQKTVNIKPELIANGQAHVGNFLHKYKIPIIVKGPVGWNVHSYDEYVAIESIPQTSEIYAKTVAYFFGLANPSPL
mgnify:CR=1 FL=1